MRLNRCWFLVMAMLLFIVTPVVPVVESVWIGPPVDIVNGEAVRIDFQTVSNLDHPVVKLVVACSSIDKPFIAYDERNPSATGCRSPGYTSMEIFTEKKEHDRGSLASKFAVRRDSRSLYVRKRLLDLYSPLVYLEIHGVVEESSAQYRGLPTPWVGVTRYFMKSRYRPLHATVGTDMEQEKHNGVNSNNEESSIDRDMDKEPLSIFERIKRFIASILGITENNDDDGVSVAKEVDDYTEESKEHLKTYMGLHWSMYSATIAMIVAVLSTTIIYLVFLVVVAYQRRKRKMSKNIRRNSDGSDTVTIASDAWKKTYSGKKLEQKNMEIREWIGNALQSGVYSSSAFITSAFTTGKDRNSDHTD